MERDGGSLAGPHMERRRRLSGPRIGAAPRDRAAAPGPGWMMGAWRKQRCRPMGVSGDTPARGDMGGMRGGRPCWSRAPARRRIALSVAPRVQSSHGGSARAARGRGVDGSCAWSEAAAAASPGSPACRVDACRVMCALRLRRAAGRAGAASLSRRRVRCACRVSGATTR